MRPRASAKWLRRETMSPGGRGAAPAAGWPRWLEVAPVAGGGSSRVSFILHNPPPPPPEHRSVRSSNTERGSSAERREPDGISCNRPPPQSSRFRCRFLPTRASHSPGAPSRARAQIHPLLSSPQPQSIPSPGSPPGLCRAQSPNPSPPGLLHSPGAPSQAQSSTPFPPGLLPGPRAPIHPLPGSQLQSHPLPEPTVPIPFPPALPSPHPRVSPRPGPALEGATTAFCAFLTFSIFVCGIFSPFCSMRSLQGFFFVLLFPLGFLPRVFGS